MMATQRRTLLAALAAAESALPRALAAEDHDQLRLDLPPIVPVAGDVPLTPEALHSLAALYLYAELEQAGVIPVAECLVEARTHLTFLTSPAAGRLEEFARLQRESYDRRRREQVFARLFGLGGAARPEEGSAVNRDFERSLAALCQQLTRVAEETRSSAAEARRTTDAALAHSALGLALNLAGRQFASTPAAAQRIAAQLRRASTILSDPEVRAAFHATGQWEVVRAVLGDQAPDIGRLVARAEAGLGVLRWLAGVLPRLAATHRRRPLLDPRDPVTTDAARWLAATGLRVPDTRARPGSSGLWANDLLADQTAGSRLEDAGDEEEETNW